MINWHTDFIETAPESVLTAMPAAERQTMEEGPCYDGFGDGPRSGGCVTA